MTSLLSSSGTVQTITVALGDRSYPIAVGTGALPAQKEALADIIGAGQAVIVADATVWALHGEALQRDLGAVPVIQIPSGEASKSFPQYAALCEELLATGMGRDGTLIAFGGGVVGDLAGFAAATLRRGCQFVQVPTTLLAHVDSSVGGKTAINATAGKNLIGAFYQPQMVISDTDFLATLPDREMRAGYAEIVKYGLLGDAAFFGWLEANGKDVLAKQPEALAHAIAKCCAMKAAIVAEDEREGGKRALLNLGHTFGHALEAAMGYTDRLLHGEGVAIGMAMAYRFAADQGLCGTEDAERVAAHLSAHGLGTSPRHIEGLVTDAEAQIGAMYQDKKVEGGRLTLILPQAIGVSDVVKNVDPAPLLDFLQRELS